MAFYPVTRAGTTTAFATANTTAISDAIAAAVGSYEGIELEPGTWYLEAASGGSAVSMPINFEIRGQPVDPGDEPVTMLVMHSRAGSGMNCISQTGSSCTGIKVKYLSIDGGRTASAATGATSGAALGLAGQSTYTTHNGVEVQDCRIFNGVMQQTSINSLWGATFTRVKTWATQNPTNGTGPHGGDHDAVAYDKPSKFIEYIDCDLDSWGQECFKLENCEDITFTNTRFNNYMTITQDRDPYSQMARVKFVRCWFDSYLTMSGLTWRHIPTSAAGVTNTTTVTLSGTGTIGSTITATRATTAFTNADVGKALVGINSLYGQGIVESETGGTLTIRVYIPYTNVSLTANNSELVYCDNGGDGSITFEGCTFTENGAILGTGDTGSGAYLSYGTQTIKWCAFHKKGNSYSYPSAVSPVLDGNLLGGMPLKRFAIPSSAVTTKLPYGFAGRTGVNEYAVRLSPTAVSYQLPSAVANTGDEVILRDGVFPIQSGTFNCNAKAITIKAENRHRAIIDATSEAAAARNGFSSSADPAGAILDGVVFQNFTFTGNNVGVNITGGSITVRNVVIRNIHTSNGGAGIRISSGATPTIEDFYIEDCGTDGTAGGGGINNAAAGAVFRRGVIHNCTSALNRGSGAGTGTGGGIRNQTNAGAVYENISITNCTGGGSGGGSAFSEGATVKNAVMAGNTTTGSGRDIWVNNGKLLTIDSSIMWSADDGSIHPINNGTSGNIDMDNCTVRGGASAGQFGNAGGTNSWVNVSSTDPSMVDAANGNTQLTAASDNRGGQANPGLNTTDVYDYFKRPFTAANRGAWA